MLHCLCHLSVRASQTVVHALKLYIHSRHVVQALHLSNATSWLSLQGTVVAVLLMREQHLGCTW